MSEHDQPLGENHLNPRLISRHAIPLCLESRILEDQHASDWNLNPAQRCLSQRLPLDTIQENFCPGFGIDLDSCVKSDHGLRGFVAIDNVGQPLSEIAVPIFERMRSCRYLQ